MHLALQLAALPTFAVVGLKAAFHEQILKEFRLTLRGIALTHGFPSCALTTYVVRASRTDTWQINPIEADDCQFSSAMQYVSFVFGSLFGFCG